MRQALSKEIFLTPIYSPTVRRKPQVEPPSEFCVTLGAKLKHLRENVRHMSPEDVAARVSANGHSVSSSYIYRVEKGINSPTAEMLAVILEALDSNLGLFFEDLITGTADTSSEDRRCHRILQRLLDKDHAGTVSVINVLEKTL